MKRKLAMLLVFMMILASFSACGKKDDTESESSSTVSAGEETEETEDTDSDVIYDESLLPDVTVEESSLDDILEKLENIEEALYETEWFRNYDAVLYSSTVDEITTSLNSEEQYYSIVSYDYMWAPNSVSSEYYAENTVDVSLLSGTDYVELGWKTLAGELSSLTLTVVYEGHDEEYISIANKLENEIMSILTDQESADQFSAMYYNQSETISYKGYETTITKTGEVGDYNKTTTYEISVGRDGDIETTDSIDTDISSLGYGYASSMSELQANMAEDFMFDAEVDMMLSYYEVADMYSYALGDDAYTYYSYRAKDNENITVDLMNNMLLITSPIADGYDFESFSSIVLSNVATRITGEQQVIVDSSAEAGGYTFEAYDYGDGYIMVYVG